MTNYDTISALAPARRAVRAGVVGDHPGRHPRGRAGSRSSRGAWWRAYPSPRRGPGRRRRGHRDCGHGSRRGWPGRGGEGRDPGLQQPAEHHGQRPRPLDDPELVAQFEISDGGIFAIWIATSSSGKVCYASSDGVWDGEGAPTRSELEYGCGGGPHSRRAVLRAADPSRPARWVLQGHRRPDRLRRLALPGRGPGRVRGSGVDRTLPLRPDSHGYGAAIPEASDASAVTLTFLDAAGRELGTRRLVAPVG